MFAYCVGVLRLSEEAARKRIHAARAARRFPAIFDAVAEGRLHLCGVVLLAPHLTETTAADLLAAAAGKRKAEIERLLAERFPRSEVLAWVASMPASGAGPVADQRAPGRVEGPQLVAGQGAELPQPAPGHVRGASRVTPLSSQSYDVQFTMDQEAHALLCEAEELLGHQVASGDVAAVVKRALQELVPRLRKQKFAATDRPRSGQSRPRAGKRHIPAADRRAAALTEAEERTRAEAEAKAHAAAAEAGARAKGNEVASAGMPDSAHDYASGG